MKLLRRLGSRGLLLRVAALEALDPATGVDQLLLPRVEGVAFRAELDAQAGHRRPRRELVAARAVNLARDVLGVDVGLHSDSMLTGETGLERPPGAVDSRARITPFRPEPWRSRRGTRRWSWCGAAC